jgi:hypothetical protein
MLSELKSAELISYSMYAGRGEEMVNAAGETAG